MDDLERQIVEIRKTVLNLSAAEMSSHQSDKQLFAEIEEIKKRLANIEDILGEQNGKQKYL